MASEAQICANRFNAKKSTGPRTTGGKAVVAQNAVKHGLMARQAVIAGEDLGEYEFYRDQMLAELEPEGAMESMLAQRAVGLAWRLLRAERLQNEAFDALHAKDTTGPLARLTQSLRSREQGRVDSDADGRDLTCGRIVVRDFANARVLDRLLMYERRLEHSLYRTTAELQRLRLLRQLDSGEETPTPRPAQAEKAPPDRAKQTQFAPAPTEAKCLFGKDIGENVPPTPVPEQSQTNPIWRQTGGCRPETGGSQAAKATVYSTPIHAGRDAEHSAGAVMVLDRVGKESL